MPRIDASIATAYVAVGACLACADPAPMPLGGDDGGAGTSGSGGGITSAGGGTSGSGGIAVGGSSTEGGGSAVGGATGGLATNGGTGAAAGGSGAGGTDGAAGTPAGGSAGGAGTKLMISVDGIRVGERLCFRPEASSSGGNHSPRIDWSGVPAGARSLALTMYDQSNQTPHRIVCNLTPDTMAQAADVGSTVPAGAQVSTGHNRAGNAWYGPGAGGAPHSYEIRIWALATPMLEGGCATSGAGPTRAVYEKLRAAGPTLVLDSAHQILWGNANGECVP